MVDPCIGRIRNDLPLKVGFDVLAERDLFRVAQVWIWLGFTLRIKANIGVRIPSAEFCNNLTQYCWANSLTPCLNTFTYQVGELISVEVYPFGIECS